MRRQRNFWVLMYVVLASLTIFKQYESDKVYEAAKGLYKPNQTLLDVCDQYERMMLRHMSKCDSVKPVDRLWAKRKITEYSSGK